MAPVAAVSKSARILCLALLTAALLAEPAWASGTAGSVPSAGETITRPSSKGKRPKLFRLTPEQAERIADRSEKVRAYLKRFKSYRSDAFIKGPGRWQVNYFTGGDEVAQVMVDDFFGTVQETWVGPQVSWTMARGVDGAFGRKVNAPWVWVPLMVMFILPFLRLRKPLRLLHLDLLVLLAFSASHYFFNRGEIFTSVPLAYPPLIYLFFRMLLAGFIRTRDGYRRRGRGSVSFLPVMWLAFALVFLIGFRVALNVLDSNVIDVGYSGVIGAERLTSGESIYGGFPADNGSGDTYGPVAYYAYVPFELALPWGGKWDSLPAAHAAAIFFDLATMLGLFLLGSRFGGRALGVTFAYAWAAYPYTLYVMNSNTNDALMPMLLVYGMLLMSSAPARGLFLALASATKFASAALAPLWMSYLAPGERWRSRLWFALGFAVTIIAVMAPVMLGTGLETFWDRTVGFQLGRKSPFSIWGLHPVRYGTLHDVLKIAFASLAVIFAFVPRRKDIFQVAALSAALLIALQMVMTHWFYLYIVWFFPFVMVVLFRNFANEPKGTRDQDLSEGEAATRSVA